MTDLEITEKIKQICNEHKFTRGKILSSSENKCLHDYIMSHTQFLDEFDTNLTTRAWFVVNNLKLPFECIVCGKPIAKQVIKDFSTGKYSIFCSPSCECKHLAVQDKMKQTNRLKYGCEYTFQSENNKTKSKQTMMNKYGVEFALQCKEIHDKSDATRAERYGNKSMLCTESGMKSFKDTTTQNFFNKLQHNGNVVPCFTIDEYRANGKQSAHEYHWKCLECGNEFNSRLSISWFKQGCNRAYARCPNCYPTEEGKSSEEIGFMHYLQSISPYEVKSNLRILESCINDRRTLKEIDVYIPELKIGFEFDGIFFHSLERNRIDLKSISSRKGYHLNKTILAEQQGISLVHIRSDEWKLKRSETENLVKDIVFKSIDYEKFYNVENDIYVFDRSKFNKAYIHSLFAVIDETTPELVEVKISKNQIYHYENCGKLICKKLI